MTSHKPRKRFGQNFLTDTAIVNAIVCAIAPSQHQHLVEIGPGLGAMTEVLLAHVAEMDAIEIDRDLVPRLQTRFGKQLHIHEADALTVDFSQLVKKDQRLRVVGNLPYNISTPLIFHLLDTIDAIEDMHFMLQKEVVDRLCARPGSKAFGRLSVMVQYFCETSYLFSVPPESFDPPPKVDSAIVRLVPHARLPIIAHDLERFATVVKQAFSQRRKTILNTLKPLMHWRVIQEAGVDPSSRAEQLSVADFVRISNTWCATLREEA